MRHYVALYRINVSDTVSWTGSLTLAVDINEFNLGSFSPANAGIGGLTDIQLTFAEPVAQSVPEPATILGLLTFSALALGSRRKLQK
jgi:hypothetical protein